jgi:DNA-binding MarR family transcriptional regulator
VFLTSKGRALIAEILPLHAVHVGALLEGLNASERRELRQLLGKLRDSLAASASHEKESP